MSLDRTFTRIPVFQALTTNAIGCCLLFLSSISTAAGKMDSIAGVSAVDNLSLERLMDLKIEKVTGASRYVHSGSGEHYQECIEHDGRKFRAKLMYGF